MVKFNYQISPQEYTWKNAFLWGNFKAHLSQAFEGKIEHRCVHLLIALIQFFPILSQITSVAEKMIVESQKSSSKHFNAHIPLKNTSHLSLLQGAFPSLPPKIQTLCKNTQDNFGNTGLTKLLATHEDESEIHDLLQKLISYFEYPEVKIVLRAPNSNKLDGNQNTPLCLLVKQGNLKGVELLLPLLKKEDLLFQTPRGNNVLHLALATGQMQLAFTLMQRADELGALEEICTQKNVHDLSPKTLFDKMLFYFNKNYNNLNAFYSPEIFLAEKNKEEMVKAKATPINKPMWMFRDQIKSYFSKKAQIILQETMNRNQVDSHSNILEILFSSYRDFSDKKKNS